MTAPTLTLDEARHRLASAPWLRKPATQLLFAVLAAGGVTARAVGGAVRNTLIDRPVDDVDLASPAPPETIMRLSEAAGFAVVPTGLAHGTVTVVIDHQPFEVTTLRRDVSTDGRRATVAFTEDWEADAQRRDFTMNALYCGADGTVFDPVGGLADLAERRVRFIGDADTRIREDYLRILRFFRFYAAFGVGELDTAGWQACARGVSGLSQLSGERIRAEMLKLLVAPRVIDAVTAMHAVGVLDALVGPAVDRDALARLVAIEAFVQRPASGALRLAALAVQSPNDCARLADRLRLSGLERQILDEAALPFLTIDNRERLYRLGRDSFERAILIGWLRSSADTSDAGWAEQLDLPAHWSPPPFPLDGKALLSAGIPAGPALGARLRRAERIWIDQGFVGTQDSLLAQALQDSIAKE
jgi:poly(A) polymerase